MNKKKVHGRLDEQIAEAGRQCRAATRKLKSGIHIFKPDSPKLETVVAVDIGLRNERTQVGTSLRAFYSPAVYGYPSAARLEKDIQAYLESTDGEPGRRPLDSGDSKSTR